MGRAGQFVYHMCYYSFKHSFCQNFGLFSKIFVVAKGNDELKSDQIKATEQRLKV